MGFHKANTMRRIIFFQTCVSVLFIIGKIDGGGTGEAWPVSPYSKINHPLDYPLRSNSQSSALEIHSISGVGHSKKDPAKSKKLRSANWAPVKKFYKGFGEIDEMNLFDDSLSRQRRDTVMEEIANSKSIREARLSSPETWSRQPLSIEFRRRTTLDQVLQQQQQQQQDQQDGNNDGNIAATIKQYQPPRTDFVTANHHRYNYAENRESREIPIVARTSEDYEMPWYRNAIRERDYDYPMSRRGYNYYYPDRYSYRMERDYYVHPSIGEPTYIYDRYRGDDLDLYGRNRPTPKPKRIIYFATLPEVVRKPVDLRSYSRPYELPSRNPDIRDGTHNRRAPGNIDPNRPRYRYPYDESYESYPRRSNLMDHSPFSLFTEDDGRRKAPLTNNKENLRANDDIEVGQDGKLLTNQAPVVDSEENKVPWPVQIGTVVSVKEDERIPGRKIFSESNGYERLQSAQLRTAPDSNHNSTETKSTEE